MADFEGAGAVRFDVPSIVGGTPARITNVFVPTVGGVTGLPAEAGVNGVNFFFDKALRLNGDVAITVVLRSLRPDIAPDYTLQFDADASELIITEPEFWIYGRGFVAFLGYLNLVGCEGAVFRIDALSAQANWDQISDLDGLPINSSLVGHGQSVSVFGNATGTGEVRFAPPLVTGRRLELGQRGQQPGTRPFSIPVDPPRPVPEQIQGHGMVRVAAPTIRGASRLTALNTGRVVADPPGLDGAATTSLIGIGATQSSAASLRGRGSVVLRRPPRVTVTAPSLGPLRRVGSGLVTVSCQVTATAHVVSIPRAVPATPPPHAMAVALQDEAWLLSLLNTEAL